MAKGVPHQSHVRRISSTSALVGIVRGEKGLDAEQGLWEPIAARRRRDVYSRQ